MSIQTKNKKLAPKDFVPARKLAVMGYVPDGVVDKNQPLHICVVFEASYNAYNAGEKAWLVRSHAEEVVRLGFARRAVVEDLSQLALERLIADMERDGTLEVTIEEPEVPEKEPVFDTTQFKRAIKNASRAYGTDLVKKVMEFYDIPAGRGRTQQQTSWGTVVLRKIIENTGFPESPPMVPWFDESMKDVYEEQWTSIVDLVTK